jgi:hypothetical protein
MPARDIRIEMKRVIATAVVTPPLWQVGSTAGGASITQSLTAFFFFKASRCASGEWPN